MAAIEDPESVPPYDKEKYKEMILESAETVLGYFGFDRTVILRGIEEEEAGRGIKS